MKTLIALISLVTLTAFARAEEIEFMWSYPADTNNIVFKLYMSTSTPPMPPDIKTFTLVATTTNLTTVFTNTATGVCTFFVTASNTVRQAESPPSNTIQLPAMPISPTTFRINKLIIRPGP